MMWLSLCTAGKRRPPTSLQGPQPPSRLAHRACSRAREPCRSGPWGEPPPRLLTPHLSAWLRLVSHQLQGRRVVCARGPFPLLSTLLFLSLGPELVFHLGLAKSEGCAWPCKPLLRSRPLPQGVYDQCEALLRPPFDACHPYVSPLPFTASCTSDLCQ